MTLHIQHDFMQDYGQSRDSALLFVFMQHHPSQKEAPEKVGQVPVFAEGKRQGKQPRFMMPNPRNVV